MAENIREVIARLKNNQQSNSQQSKPKPVPQETKVKEVPQETEGLNDAEDDYVDDEEEEVPEIDQKPVENAEDQTVDQQIAMEIELLQNDGRYRVELLHQMQEINKSLLGIAEILVDLAGKNGKA